MALHNYTPMVAMRTLASLALTFLRAYFRILFLTAGFLFAIFKFLFSLAITVLSPIYSVVSPIVSPMIATYLTFITSLNAGFSNFLQPLLAHVPWLGRILQPMVRFIFPIRFVPAFQVVQGIFMLAAVPYIAAAAVGTVMFVYTFGVGLIINGARVVYDYFFADSIGTNTQNRSTKVTHKYPGVVGTLKKASNKISDLYNDRHNAWDRRTPRSAVLKVFLISLQCASLLVLMPVAFLHRLVTFGIESVYGIAHAFSDACTAAGDAFKATLDIPVLRIMRRPFITVDNTPLKEEIRQSSEPGNNKENGSKQTTNTPQLYSRAHMQPCLVEISQRKTDTSTFGTAAASFRHTYM